MRYFAILVLALGLLVSIGNPALAIEPDDDPAPVVEQSLPSDPSEVESSWTRADLLDAIPLDSPQPEDRSFGPPSLLSAQISAKAGNFVVSDPAAFPQRLQGRVFFRVGNQGFACSGTLVSSRHLNAIYTAGHCVFDRATRSFVSDLIFAPGYNQGTASGLYPAIALGTTKGWVRGGSFSADIGMAVLAGNPVIDQGGSRAVAFNLNPKRRHYTVYGYPADPAPVFNGEHLIGCHAHFAGRDRGKPRTVSAFPCVMGHGASGGGWLTHGFLNGVNSYIYCETVKRLCGYVFTPYFSRAAKSLYTSKMIGGSIPPALVMLHSPPRLVHKRKVHFRFLGIASTPMRYRCKFDHRHYQGCRARTSISRLTPGHHVLRVKAVDQTGRWARNTLKRKFRMSPR